MRLTRRDRLVLFSPLAVLLGGWLLLPALLGFMATFSTYSPFSTTLNFAGLDNYASVVSDPQFAAAARNLAIFTAVAVPLELVVGFGVAYILRLPVRGRTLWRILLLVPWLVSPRRHPRWVIRGLRSQPRSRSKSGASHHSSRFFCCPAWPRSRPNAGRTQP